MNVSKSSDRRSTGLCFRAATVGLIVGSLVLPSAAALAAPPPSASPSDAAVAPEPDPTVARSRSLFDKGLDAYEANDYAGATHYWTEAHELMAQRPELSASRRILGFDLAQAQMRAYATDHHQSRIATAKPLLEEFVAWVDRPAHTMDEAEKQDRARAIELLDQIDQIEQAETAPPPPPPPSTLEAPHPAPAPAPPPAAPTPDGSALLLGGGLAMGGGVASVVAVFGLARRGRAAEERYSNAIDSLIQSMDRGEDTRAAEAEITAADRDGRRANIGLLTSMTSAVVLTTAGITMLAIGGHRRKRHVSASAALTPSFAGASLSARF